MLFKYASTVCCNRFNCRRILFRPSLCHSALCFHDFRVLQSNINVNSITKMVSIIIISLHRHENRSCTLPQSIENLYTDNKHSMNHFSFFTLSESASADEPKGAFLPHQYLFPRPSLVNFQLSTLHSFLPSSWTPAFNPSTKASLAVLSPRRTSSSPPS